MPLLRTVDDVTIEDTFTRVLTRYALLSFTYNLGNFKQPERGATNPRQALGRRGKELVGLEW